MSILSENEVLISRDHTSRDSSRSKEKKGKYKDHRPQSDPDSRRLRVRFEKGLLLRGGKVTQRTEKKNSRIPSQSSTVGRLTSSVEATGVDDEYSES